MLRALRYPPPSIPQPSPQLLSGSHPPDPSEGPHLPSPPLVATLASLPQRRARTGADSTPLHALLASLADLPGDAEGRPLGTCLGPLNQAARDPQSSGQASSDLSLTHLQRFLRNYTSSPRA